MSKKKKQEQELQQEDTPTPDMVDESHEPVDEADEMPVNSDNGATVDSADGTDEALDTLLMQRDQFKDALQRERADFINFKKRVEREKAEMKAVTTADTVARFLPIIDDFDRAMAAVPSDATENSWLLGFTMIHKKFSDLLTQFGVEVIDPLGEPFDPNYHEAISSEDSDEYESNMVTAVLQKGYKLDDRCIRVAMVKVAN